MASKLFRPLVTPAIAGTPTVLNNAPPAKLLNADMPTSPPTELASNPLPDAKFNPSRTPPWASPDNAPPYNRLTTPAPDPHTAPCPAPPAAAPAYDCQLLQFPDIVSAPNCAASPIPPPISAPATAVGISPSASLRMIGLFRA